METRSRARAPAFIRKPARRDVSEDRLRRFFVKEHGGYRVRRELREMVLFAAHDLLKDPPFSRMDLISCRNLLIYLNAEAQARALDIFHFAMRPHGRLFLGSSESVDENNSLFRVLDKKHRIYVHQPAFRSGLPIPVGPSTLLRTMDAHERADDEPVVHGKRFVHDAGVPFHGIAGPTLDRAALAELHYRLIEKFSSPSVMVNAAQEHRPPFAAGWSLFAVFRRRTDDEPVASGASDVTAELRAALFRVSETKRTDAKFRRADRHRRGNASGGHPSFARGRHRARLLARRLRIALANS
jgi:two-component system CheB/CheR fusion protein